MERWLPEGAGEILERLEKAGFEAYAVGGCVRDALLGRAPKDWDICTSAMPEETLAVFSDCQVIQTGIRHGTVLVLLEDGGYEVTTYRIDGDYADHRHPEGVTFVRSLEEDLARRDFTVNAMAWNPKKGLVDCFGGQEDLKKGIIRCVGEPECRFEEDGLRILRGLRFAARYGFVVEEETAAALVQKAPLLLEISGERVFAELSGLLTSPGAEEILRQYRSVFAVILPELAPMFDHPQYNYHHCFDVWEHTLHAVGAVEPTEVLRFTMLLHDSGKPGCFFRDEAGVGHFHGHPAESVRLAAGIFERLRCSNQLRDTVLELIRWHDRVRIFNHTTVHKLLSRLGAERSRLLFQVMRADALAQNPVTHPQKLSGLQEGERLLEELIAEGACCTLRDLAVKGDDLMAEGERPGKRLGGILQTLLDAVIDEEVENDREALLELYRAMRGHFDH